MWSDAVVIGTQTLRVKGLFLYFIQFLIAPYKRVSRYQYIFFLFHHKNIMSHVEKKKSFADNFLNQSFSVHGWPLSKAT